ncbi:MAG: glycoside hydrolase family 9 protein [Ruminococcus sp.]|jgi:hypothetical protein|nr:glycoside hydrolase family 9 protein [Ruminococcus sp.]
MKKTKGKVISLVTSAVMACSIFLPYPAANKPVDAASEYVNYAKALQYSLYLYDANMCGKSVDEKSDLAWRSDCHTTDSYTYQGVTHDISGGYHDAGDHVKFGLPQAYSMAALGLGYYTFKDAFTQTGTAGHLKTITDHYAEYAKKCTWLNASKDNATCFVYTVGNGKTDHAYWGAPENQGVRNDQIYAATAGGVGRDVVASAAGALAMNYLNFKNPEDLTYATALFNMAKGMSGVAVEGNTVGDETFYGSTSADSWLYFASVALQKCGVNAQGGTDNQWAEWPFGWNNPEVGAHILTNSLKPDNDLVYFRTKKDSSGYIFMDKWGSARLNVQLQFAGLAYDKLNGGSTYSAQAREQMDIIFGSSSVTAADGIKKCLMVGYNENSSKYPHHRAASGYGTGPQGQTSQAHVLVGALCGGPETGSGGYADTANNYVANEVAIDYNACFVGALAGLYLKYGTGDETVNASVGGDIPEVRGFYGAGAPIDPDEPTTTTTETPAQPGETTTVTTVNPPISSGYGITKIVSNSEIDWGDTVRVFGKISGFASQPNAADFTFKQNGAELGINVAQFDDSTTLQMQIKTTVDNSYFEVYYQGEHIGNIAYGTGTAPELVTPEPTTTTEPATTTELGTTATTTTEPGTTSATTPGEVATTPDPNEPTDPVTSTSDEPTDPVTSTPNEPTDPVTPTPDPTDPVTSTPDEPTDPVTSTPDEPTDPVTPTPDPTDPVTSPPDEPVTPTPDPTDPVTSTPDEPTDTDPVVPTPDEPAEMTVCGDVNLDGDAKIADLVALCKHVVGVVGANLTGTSLANADCNDDGYVNSSDALSLAKYIVKKISSLPEIS